MDETVHSFYQEPIAYKAHVSKGLNQEVNSNVLLSITHALIALKLIVKTSVFRCIFPCNSRESPLKSHYFCYICTTKKNTLSINMNPSNLNDLDKDLPEDKNQQIEEAEEETTAAKSGYKVPPKSEGRVSYHLSGMYQNWFLDYASYVILERAVPHINDGFKPVQRRILHSMRSLEDGRYNKVANIVGNTMQYHPHGDASIGDALVQLGQKDLLIDCQGNWGNILTGDGAAASRYIEARLSKFAMETVFNPKTTEWKLSYDGRRKEPITLPVKFPLLLAQGVEGIAVGLSSKILPHNFNELIDASIAYLKKEKFELYPDFQTGGYIDVSRYNDGERGGSVRVRAKIGKYDNRTLVISEIPFGKTTSSVIDSIIKANEKGKIKIKRIDDNTAADVEILVHLMPGVSSDRTIDALYAFTDCEISISPNCCVIQDNKPHFLKVSDVLTHSTECTKDLLKLELEIHKSELEEALFFASLEQLFIENRIYKDKEFEEATNMDKAIAHVDLRLEPFKPNLIREVTKDDILRLMEIKMGRILKFNAKKNEELIASYKKEIANIKKKLAQLVQYTIEWFEMLKEKYGAGYPRHTEIRSFDTIEVSKVVEANQKLYFNRSEGFVGTALKKDDYLFNCSDLDDIIIFYRDCSYKVIKVSDKVFIGQNVVHINIFQRNDTRTIYNIVYRDGKSGTNFIKRCAITGVMRDKEYRLDKGTEHSRILYFSANPNGEAETIKVILKPKLRQRILLFEKDFSEITIRSRSTYGVILTKSEIHKISLKQKGVSTLGGIEVWFDHDVLRLNHDGRGEELGEFNADDSILVVQSNGDYHLTNYDLSNHYEKGIIAIEKYDPDKLWTAIYYEHKQKAFYMKRFLMDARNSKLNFLGEDNHNVLHLLTDEKYPRIELVFPDNSKQKEPLIVDAEEFTVIRSFKARGRKLTDETVEIVNELPPEKQDKEPTIEDDSDDTKEDKEGKSDSSGQLNLFND